MDDAATPVPWRSVLPILGVMFVDGVNMMLVFPFVPFLVRSTLRLSLEDPNTPLMSGLMGAAFLLGQFFASPVYGPLSDRRGRRPVLLSCMAVSTAFLLAFGLAESYWFAMACRFLQGLSAGALTVGKLYLVDISDATNEARIFSYIGVAMGSGAICGPMLGGLLSNLPPASAPDGPIRLVLERYPYLPPCAAAAAMAGVVWLATALHLRETLHQGDASLSAALMAPPRTSPRLRTPRKPLSSGAAFVAGPARTTVAGGGPLPRGRGALAADAHAEGSEKGRRGPADAQADPARRSGCELVCQQLSRPCVLVGAEEVCPPYPPPGLGCVSAPQLCLCPTQRWHVLSLPAAGQVRGRWGGGEPSPRDPPLASPALQVPPAVERSPSPCRLARAARPSVTRPADVSTGASRAAPPRAAPRLGRRRWSSAWPRRSSRTRRRPPRQTASTTPRALRRPHRSRQTARSAPTGQARSGLCSCTAFSFASPSSG